MYDAEQIILLENSFDQRLSGAKAKNLGEIIRLGMPVPKGLVLSRHVLEEFLRDHRLNPLALSIKQIPKHTLYQYALEIQTKLKDAKIADELLEAIALRIENIIGKKAVIVRSSAIGEDSTEASFAGQLDSVVVNDIERELETAILKCWASYWHEHNILYQINRNCFLDGMGIIIQELVDSAVSGVLFTRHFAAQPHLNRNKRTLIAEFCFGLGEKLVSGAITPGRLEIAKDGSGWEVTSLPIDQESTGSENTFNFSWVSKLAGYAVKLEQHFACPQDIEWTVDRSGNLFILQSRPLTVKRPRKIVWSNANMNENYPDPVCPLLGSIAQRSYYHYFRNLGKNFGIPEKYLRKAEAALSNTVGIQTGRLYYNLTNIYACIRFMPFSNELVKGWDSFIGIYENLEEEPSKNPLNLKVFSKYVFLLQVIFTTLWSFSFMSLRIKRFVDYVNEHVRRYQKKHNAARENSQKKASFAEENELVHLNEAFKNFFTIRFHRWKNASLADAAALVTYRLLNKTLSRWIPENTGSNRQNTLLKGIPNMITIKPSQKLWELADHIKKSPRLRMLFKIGDNKKILKMLQKDVEYSEFNQRLNEYLENWGFRCPGELMLSYPNYQEQPEGLIELIKRYVESHAPEPIERLKKQAVYYEQDKKNVILELKKRKNKIPFLVKKHLLLVVLWMTHKSILYRELVRFKQAQLYSIFRQTILEIGKLMSDHHLIKHKDDIFYFKYPEIQEFLDKPSDLNKEKLHAAVEERRSKHERYLQMHPSTTLILKEGEVFEEAHIPSDDETKDGHTPNESYFTGIAASPGKVRGPAKNLSSVFGSNEIRSGDILVTKQTDPGWGPIFPLIKGLVLEKGGMLSHGAIIAREFGIPAVVDVKGATHRIKSGQIILVDGDDGTVSY